MTTSTQFFHGIKERVHVFIPLDFKHPRDNRSLWRTGFFSYLDRVWEWVQVTCDHVANHYTALAHAYAATKASFQMHRQVSRIAPPTACSLAITLPSVQLSNKDGAMTHPWGSLQNIKVHPGSSDPPSDWRMWEEYLKSKLGEFTPDQIVAEITQNRVKIDKTVARILKTFNWYFPSRLIAVIGQFEKHVGMDNPGERWRQALLDFAYQNIGFDLKKLIRVLCCDLQVAIDEGLVKVQDDLLEAIVNFTDNFHITVTMLSAPQVHALLNHMCGSHSFLAAVRHGTTLTKTESSLKNGPAKLLQSFFNRLPDHQIDIERDLTHLTGLEVEVNHFSTVLRTHLVDVTSNPTLMLNFNCGVEGVPTINLTKDEIEVHYPPHRVILLRTQKMTWRCQLQCLIP